MLPSLHPQAIALSIAQLRATRDDMAARIDEGLRRGDAPIAALPTFVSPPRAPVSGDALVLDLGGTHLRAALVRITQGGAEVLRGPISAPFPETDSATVLFDQQAALAQRVAPRTPVALGYCFSYPATPTADGDAVLLKWTKGIAVRDAVGRPVGAALRAALTQRDVVITETCVINDTVATLMSAALRDPEHAPQYIGLVVGTGTNMAVLRRRAEVPKLNAPDDNRLVAINLESGNYDPPHRCELDDRLERDEPPPGAQRFEKAVAGRYLDRLLRLAHPECRVAAHLHGGARLAALATQSKDAAAAAWASALLARSADLVAAGLCAVAGVTGAHAEIPVLGEGSVLWRTSGYRERVRERVHELSGGALRAKLRRARHCNLVGAAHAVLARVAGGP